MGRRWRGLPVAFECEKKRREYIVVIVLRVPLLGLPSGSIPLREGET